MTASLQEQKQQYAKQLAAHTLRQWNSFRQPQATDGKDKPQGKATPDGERDRENQNAEYGETNGQTTPGRQRGARSSRRGIQAVDFASRRSPKNTTTSEGEK